MYPTSQEYNEKIKETDRDFNINIQIRHSGGVLELSRKDLSLNSIVHSEGSQAGEVFNIGGVVASSFNFEIKNRPELAHINFMGATILPRVSLLIRKGADAHFLQPSQPSKMLGFEDLYEDVPLGVFSVDSVKANRFNIAIKSIDNIAKLEIPYKLSKLSYPASLYQIYVNICNICDVTPATINFPNKSYIVQQRPEGDYNCRDIIKFVAELAGCFARMNRYGGLEIKWYQNTNLELNTSNRFDFYPNNDKVKITGITAKREDTVYLIGTEDYSVDLSNNPLLQDDLSSVLNNVFNNVKDTEFTPFNSNWQGNPALEAGDKIVQIDRDGIRFDTIVTNSTYKYGGRCSLSAKGIPIISKGYKGSTDKMVATIKQNVKEDIGDQLSNLEQAQLNAMELLSNMLGGHFIEDKENGIMYIANNPDISKATEWWQWGLGGFAHFKNGVPDTSITADGSIVAMLVAANIITANMIVAGILQSNDGGAYFDLDNRVIRMAHEDGSHTLMDRNGVGRHYVNGTTQYLNGLYMKEIKIAPSYLGTIDFPQPTRVTLPAYFMNRGSQVEVLVANTGFRMFPDMNVRGSVASLPSGTIGGLDFVVEIVQKNFTSNPPYVDIRSYAKFPQYWRNTSWEAVYRETDFILMVVGK